jgi:hypothetical protein
VTTFLEKPFVKWGFYFIKLIKQIGYGMKKEYVAIKCVKVEILCTNIVVVTSKFLYEFILTKFECPLNIITEHGVHFNNDVVKYMTNHFMSIHVHFTTYYPQGNGLA